MFTGIIEETGTVSSLKKEKSNLHISVKCSFVNEVKIDQSIAHNGVCLTVIDKQKDFYTVTAIAETLNKTNLSNLKEGDLINLERCVKVNDRLDGHIVQGHVDQTGICAGIKDEKGSKIFNFEYDSSSRNITVEKGSVCVNGVSLTVVNSYKNSFSVAIIPYTLEHTNFKTLKKGDEVNLEFDILGKYVAKILAQRN